MTQTHKAVSGYRIKMQNCINQWKGEGKNTITQDELAGCMGVQIGQPFRRHIADLQTDGVVLRFTYQTEKGGYKVAYLIN